MAGPMKKKAKLAHDKREGNQKKSTGDGRFAVAKVLDLVAWPENEMSAIVDIDGKETLGLVARHFVLQDPSSGEWGPSTIACPAVYDAVARSKAVEAYTNFQAQKENA